jgi:predicted TIM-barrel fold metal-dependent hydrolase
MTDETRRGRPAAGLACALLLWWSAAAPAGEEPFADVHLHFNWDQTSVVDPGEALERLHRHGVVLGVVSSMPPEMALELSGAADGWIVPLFMPYLEPERRHDWFNDERVVPAARQALSSGRYAGLGEFHLTGGMGPNPAQRHPVVDGLMELAVEFDAPVLIHTEASSYRFFLPLCQRHPDARIVWAHAGGILPAGEVIALMEACPNVWAELSARDNDRYIQNPIVDAAGRLLPEWVALIRRFPDRVMTGTDPVWPIEYRHPWDEPDTGWDRFPNYLAFHRQWLDALPEDLARRVRLENALRFFRADRR